MVMGVVTLMTDGRDGGGCGDGDTNNFSCLGSYYTLDTTFSKQKSKSAPLREDPGQQEEATILFKVSQLRSCMTSRQVFLAASEGFSPRCLMLVARKT